MSTSNETTKILPELLEDARKSTDVGNYSEAIDLFYQALLKSPNNKAIKDEVERVRGLRTQYYVSKMFSTAEKAKSLEKRNKRESLFVYEMVLDFSNTVQELIYPPSKEINETIKDINQKILDIISELKKEIHNETLILEINQNLKLTPKMLQDKVTPFLVAIAYLQNFIKAAQKTPREEIFIREIKQNSPISVSLDGASDAIQLIKDFIVPWRRKHQEVIAHLLEQEKSLDVEIKKAEVLEKRALAERERVEVEKLRAEHKISIEKKMLEVNNLKIELNNHQIEHAIKILNLIAPELNEEQKKMALVKLLPSLNILALSEIEILTDK